MREFSATPKSMVNSLWNNRRLVIQMSKREAIGRYRGSVLGLAWSFFNPLLMLAIYTFVFTVVFNARWGIESSGGKTDFAIILFVGLIVHGLFAECINRSPSLVVSNVNYVKKVVFPLEILPWVTFGSALFHTSISLFVLILARLLLGESIPMTALLFPLVVSPLIFGTLGLTWLFASLGVFIRDISQITTMFTTVMLYISAVFFRSQRYRCSIRMAWIKSTRDHDRAKSRSTAVRTVPQSRNMGNPAGARTCHGLDRIRVLSENPPRICRCPLTLQSRFKIYRSAMRFMSGQAIDSNNRHSATSKRLFGKTPKKYHKDYWALKDVSFEINKGETVGIIGSNGSGKSTLLQLICGTLNPTGGHVQTNGRIAALLELGSGFNPEFTGRENVYMNAAVLGLSKEETDSRYDAIVEFAGIGDFIEQPVKTYSSGMYVRLAFSVATNVSPDILIVDEALAVGDAAFQAKCMRRFEEFRQRGVTILLVTHDLGSVLQFSSKCILLDAGMKQAEEEPKRAVDSFKKLLLKQNIKTEVNRQSESLRMRELQNGSWSSNYSLNTEGCEIYGNGNVTITDFGIFDQQGELANQKLLLGERYTLQNKILFFTRRQPTRSSQSHSAISQAEKLPARTQDMKACPPENSSPVTWPRQTSR